MQLGGLIAGWLKFMVENSAILGMLLVIKSSRIVGVNEEMPSLG